MTESTVYKAALEYAKSGLPIFPIAHASKNPHPMLGKEGGYHHASTDFATIDAWFASDPALSAIGGVPGAIRCAVVDVDIKHNGFEVLREHEARLGRLPETRTTLTPTGGEHRWFALPDGIEIPTQISAFRVKGVDVISATGYLLMPPSAHPKGGFYEHDAGTNELAPFPQAWADALLQSATQPASPIGERIDAGGRNATLTSLAGTMRRRGMSESAIRVALRETNATQCDPPLAEREVDAIASSVARYAPAERQTAAPKWEDPAPWPQLHEIALHGIAGQIVRALAPHTEADPAAMLFSLLTMAGAMIGGGPHLRVGSVKHEARLFIVVCGSTSSGRKGQSLADVAQIAASADPQLADAIRVSGLSTGEGLIARLRDRDDDEATEKRAFVHEPEFARLLAVAGREGSTLSAILRDAWDGSTLRVLTRKDPLEARGAFVCLTGHITEEELHKHLTSIELANGFANRMLFIASKRSRLLPSGGHLAFETVVALGHAFAAALDFARSRGELLRSPEFVTAWEQLYGTFSDEPGLAGALLARAAPHTLRLALVYALLDGAEQLELEHLAAGYAAWRYAEDSARYIFGRNLGDDVRQRLLDEIRAVYPEGLDRKAQRDLFNRHIPEAKISVARTWLIDRSLAAEKSTATEGRPRQTLFALSISEEEPMTIKNPLLPLITRLQEIEKVSPLPKRPLLPLKAHDYPTPETTPPDLSLNASGVIRGNNPPGSRPKTAAAPDEELRCAKFNSHPVDPKLPCRDCGGDWMSHQPVIDLSVA